MRILALLLLCASAHAAGVQINGNQINPASSITISSLTATNVGGSTYSIRSSSGINVLAGVVNAPAFIGNGSQLTGIIATVLPSSVAYTTTPNVFTASQSITAAGGLNVTYGITAGSVTASGAITAASFIGDGSALTGISTISTATTNTWSAPQYFSSSVNISSPTSSLIVGSSATFNGSIFANFQSTAACNLPVQTGTQTSFNGASGVIGSTLTLPSGGGTYLNMEFQGQLVNGGNDIQYTFLVDGAFVQFASSWPSNATSAACYITNNAPSQATSCKVRTLNRASAGSHTVSLQIVTGSGTWTLSASTANATKGGPCVRYYESLW